MLRAIYSYWSLRISHITCKCKNLGFFENETEIKESNSFGLHFKAGKGLKIFQPSEPLEVPLFPAFAGVRESDANTSQTDL